MQGPAQPETTIAPTSITPDATGVAPASAEPGTVVPPTTTESPGVFGRAKGALGGLFGSGSGADEPASAPDQTAAAAPQPGIEAAPPTTAIEPATPAWATTPDVGPEPGYQPAGNVDLSASTASADTATPAIEPAPTADKQDQPKLTPLGETLPTAEENQRFWRLISGQRPEGGVEELAMDIIDFGNQRRLERSLEAMPPELHDPFRQFMADVAAQIVAQQTRDLANEGFLVEATPDQARWYKDVFTRLLDDQTFNPHAQPLTVPSEIPTAAPDSGVSSAPTEPAAPAGTPPTNPLT